MTTQQRHRLSARVFFETLLPKLCGRFTGASRPGAIHFVVVGLAAQSWSLVWNGPFCAVHKGRHRRATLKVRVTSQVITDMMAGRGDPNAALMSGDLQLMGDVTELNPLLQLIAPTFSGVATRLANGA